MGGDLTAAGNKSSPSLLIQSVKDPDWANLEIGVDGRCGEPVGNTVNVDDASFSNSIGAPMLQAHWEDPEFDPKQRAFYYVRVLEIPTPNWTTFDAVKLGTKLPDDVPASIQDRAYTSPIWFTPD
jgi:hypothetical protein